MTTNKPLRNIVGGGPSILKFGKAQKSNTEFISALKANFGRAQTASQQRLNGHSSSQEDHGPAQAYASWTKQEGDRLFVPSVDFGSTGVSEERASYEITVKLFFIPHSPASCRCAQTRHAIKLVLEELQVPSVDLLIVSYPGITFDADDEEGDLSDVEGGEAKSIPEIDAEGLDSMIETWGCLEELHDEGIIGRLGVSEFGTDRLSKFLSKTRVKPEVNQINVRDCCVVPKPLILYAKTEGVDLLTHDDCQNILPSGTLREILGHGDKGAGLLRDEALGGEGLSGDINPQWVVKYTAVVKDRGVIENKGYFALAELN